MEAEKRVLVLMSSHNGEKYIETQIRSVMAQSIAEQVFLRIRDDGSQDGTCRIIGRLVNEFSGRIELIRGKKLGHNGSYFELINDAHGYDYYSFCTQNSVWLPGKLETALNALSAEDDRNPLLYASTSYLAGDDLIPYGQTRRKKRPFTIYNTAIQNICPGHTQVLNNALLRIIQAEHADPAEIYAYDSWITNHAVLYGKILFNNSSFSCCRKRRKELSFSADGKKRQVRTGLGKSRYRDRHKYHRQIEYLVKMNASVMKRQGSYQEFQKFLSAESIGEKLRYVLQSRLYRQSRLETAVFYLNVLSGNF